MNAKRKAKETGKQQTAVPYVLRALASVTIAIRLIRAARAVFGDDERAMVNTGDTRQVVLAGKAAIGNALDELGSIPIGSPSEEMAQQAFDPLYNAWDATIVVLAVMELPNPPGGEHLSICPIAGTLSMIAAGLEAIESDLQGLTQSDTKKAA